MYLATSSSPAIAAAMTDGSIGRMCSPATGTAREQGAYWAADNGAFSAKWDADKWWAFLVKNSAFATTCLFAALPDVVADWPATLARSLPWAERVRALGYRAAIVIQDGASLESMPWDQIDAVFIGGTTAWKLGPEVRELVTAAKAHGLIVHMGRVNSERRLRYAKFIGCDSADGTFLSFGPDVNLPRLQAWLRGVNDQTDLLSSGN